MRALAESPMLSSVLFWVVASVLVGLLANRVPPQWLMGCAPLRHGGRRLGERWDERRGAPIRDPLAIRRWKRWIPDAGGALPGGVRKATLVGRDPLALGRLVIETRRAELVHWLLLPAGLLPALWLPRPAGAVNLLFALAFNLPCLMLQRHNRARLRHCLARLNG